MVDRPSLSEVHESVEVPRYPSFWRRLFAFAGPAYLVSVGYMDPGNWATDIAAGSRLGYSLLWVLLMSNMMAVLLQSLSARLGIVARMDLAQASRVMFSRPVSIALWVLAEISIAACDLAEVLGSAIGLKLLFGIPLLPAVLVTVLDTFLLLFLQGQGVRLIEAFVVVLITTIGICLGIEIFLAKPDLHEVASGLIPSLPSQDALYLAIGMLGATVMPHNLYLHSALVQSRRIVHTPAAIRSGIKFNVIDSFVALNGAFFVNAALLVTAAASFHTAHLHQVSDIQEAHRLLEPILGSSLAPVAFALALILSGQSSTITGTLAGQVVMEGFLSLRLRPLVRRLVTRSIAILPAVATIAFIGEEGISDLLVLSQVILSLQLPFAVIPLVHVVSDKRFMGQYAISPLGQIGAWIVASIIVVLNIKLATEEILASLASSGQWSWLVGAIALPISTGLLVLLGYVIFTPLVQRRRRLPVPQSEGVHGPSTLLPVRPAKRPHLIAVALDFTAADSGVLAYAVMLARLSGQKGRILLLHVVESTGAHLLGPDLLDREAKADQARLQMIVDDLSELGLEATYDLGFGDPALELATLIRAHKPDLLIVGSHGHSGVSDVVYGTTIEALRHKVDVPILVVPKVTEA